MNGHIVYYMNRHLHAHVTIFVLRKHHNVDNEIVPLRVLVDSIVLCSYFYIYFLIPDHIAHMDEMVVDNSFSATSPLHRFRAIINVFLCFLNKIPLNRYVAYAQNGTYSLGLSDSFTTPFLMDCFIIFDAAG